MEKEMDLTLGGKCTMQHADDELQNCPLETYIILLTKVTPKKCNKNCLKYSRCSHKNHVVQAYDKPLWQVFLFLVYRRNIPNSDVSELTYNLT